MIAQLSRETGVTQANISHRVKMGWQIGIVNGKVCMFNPKHITEISEHHRASFDDWHYLEQRRKEGKEPTTDDSQLGLLPSNQRGPKPA